MSREDTFFHKQSIYTVLAHGAKNYEAIWLPLFDLPVREDNPEFQIFDMDPDVGITSDNFSHINPRALAVFEGANIPELQGYGFALFVRGAATVANFFPGDDCSKAMDFVRLQLGLMNQRAHSSENPYPAIGEAWLPVYAACVNFIILGEATSSWQDLLAYVSGTLWMAGFVKASTF